MVKTRKIRNFNGTSLTDACFIIGEKIAVRPREVEGETIATNTLALHPRGTPRVGTHSLPQQQQQLQQHQI